MYSVCEFSHQKATQAINFFAAQEARREIDKLKVIKLIWLADRYHLRRYGRAITNDQYWAMSYGPVGSSVKDIAEGSSFLSEDERSYSSQYLEPGTAYAVRSRRDPDLNVFSQTDIEALRFVLRNFGEYDQFQLADLSHFYPEWSKFKERLVTKETTRECMSYLDFFADPESLTDDKFRADRETVENAKAVFEEDSALASKWF